MPRRYPCPMCRKEMLLEKVHEGFEVPCPACGHRFLVPQGATDPAAPPPAAPAAFAPSAPRHAPPPRRGGDDGTMALVMGIIAVVVCQFLGPVAWYLGSRARAEARAARVEPPGNATAGWILGIVATVILVLSMCFFGLVFGLGAAGSF